MIKTTDKILLGILVILLVGMSGVFITAISTDDESSSFSGKQLVVRDVMPREANYVTSNNFEDEDEEIDVAITGSSLERASAAALTYIGEGRVTDSEVGDEEGYYEIEITLDNGNEVDVHLDENFKVLSIEYEDEEDDD